MPTTGKLPPGWPLPKVLDAAGLRAGAGLAFFNALAKADPSPEVCDVAAVAAVVAPADVVGLTWN